MKSFHLDTESIDGFLRSWPVLLVEAAILIPVGIFCHQLEWGRIVLVLIGGIAVGSTYIGPQMRERFPTARHHWLLSIGMAVLTAGVVAKSLMRDWQAPQFDFTWLATGFCAILAFVLINRKDPDVLK